MSLNPYTKMNWQNAPSTATPINATNLNKVDDQIYDVTDHLINLNASQVSYDNTSSELVSQTPQAAIDELAKPAFTQAGSRTNIASGEKLTTILGKIKKYFADLKTVAFSGSYSDLSNKPTIPTVNNGTLTIQKNGTSVATFTANQSGNVTANITVPVDTVKSETKSFSTTVPGDFYAYVNHTPTVPAGYSVVGASVFLSSATGVIFTNIAYDSDIGLYQIAIRNFTNSSVNVSGKVVFIMLKN